MYGLFVPSSKAAIFFFLTRTYLLLHSSTQAVLASLSPASQSPTIFSGKFWLNNHNHTTAASIIFSQPYISTKLFVWDIQIAQLVGSRTHYIVRQYTLESPLRTALVISTYESCTLLLKGVLVRLIHHQDHTQEPVPAISSLFIVAWGSEIFRQDIKTMKFFIFMCGLVIALFFVVWLPCEGTTFFFFARDIIRETLPYFTQHGMGHHAKQVRAVAAFLIVGGVLRLIGFVYLLILSACPEGPSRFSSICIFPLMVCFLVSTTAISAAWLWKWHIYFQENKEQYHADQCFNQAWFILMGLCGWAFVALSVVLFFLFGYIPTIIEHISGAFRATVRHFPRPLPARQSHEAERPA